MVKGIQEIPETDYKLLYDNGVNVRERYDVSIVTPNYNRGKLLENMLATVLWQDFDLNRIEMVLVDDGGEAKEIERIKALYLPFRIRYYWQEHRGRRVGRVRNIGIKQARGNVIIFLDADALASPSLIREHVEKHRKTGGLVLLGDTFDLKKGERPVFKKYLGRDSSYVHPLKFLRHYVKREFLLPALYRLRKYPAGLCFCTLHASAKREHLLAVNGFDETLDGRWGDEDLELGYRLEKRGFRVRWSGNSFVYHQWHPIHFNIRNLDNRLKIFLRHPEVLKAEKIGGLDNPFRFCRLDEIRALADAEEGAEKAAEIPPADSPGTRENRYRIAYDNRVNEQICPELSLVVPTYNRGNFLEGFLESVERQSLPKEKFEVVIADDGSEDDSLERLKGRAWPFRLRVARQDHSGCRIASNRNNGVHAAAAGIIVMADVDTLLPPELLEIHYRKHCQREPLALIGLAYYLRKNEPASRPRRLALKRFVESTRRRYLEILAEQGKFSLGTCLSTVHCSFKKRDFLSTGGFDEDFDGIWGDEDIEFGHRLAKIGVDMEFLNDTLVYHRWHDFVPSRSWCGENRLIFLIKHQELLKQRLINIESNEYFRRTISDLRCFYLWTKRLRLLGRPARPGLKARLKKMAGTWRYVIVPAAVARVRKAFLEMSHDKKTYGCHPCLQR
jgi:glycosyltransferase involved in cell wall biosynthesis